MLALVTVQVRAQVKAQEKAQEKQLNVSMGERMLKQMTTIVVIVCQTSLVTIVKQVILEITNIVQQWKVRISAIIRMHTAANEYQ